MLTMVPTYQITDFIDIFSELRIVFIMPLQFLME